MDDAGRRAGFLPARYPPRAEAASGDFSFVQISDSHIGFKNPINTDVKATLADSIAQVKAAPGSPRLLIHTGDVSHLSREDQWDDAETIVNTAGMDTHFVPGEHDVVGEDQGKAFYARFTKGNPQGGWYSLNDHGVHFIGLNNVIDLQAGGLGGLVKRNSIGWRTI